MATVKPRSILSVLDFIGDWAQPWDLVHVVGNVSFLLSSQRNTGALPWGTWTTCWWWRRSPERQRPWGSATGPTPTCASTSSCATPTRPRSTSTCPRYGLEEGQHCKAFGSWLQGWHLLSTSRFQWPNLRKYWTCQTCPSLACQFLSY